LAPTAQRTKMNLTFFSIFLQMLDFLIIGFAPILAVDRSSWR
jgi:hypothetical protein